jgi:K+-transporting ATPase A subunit
MLVPDLVQPLLLLGAVLALTPPLGGHIARVMSGERTFLDPLAGPLERLVYRALRLDPVRGQTWKAYARSLLGLSAVSIAGLYLLQWLQGLLPANPDHARAVAPWLALNTAVSFATNTDWQNYAGEATMSHLTQMAGLAILVMPVLVLVLTAVAVVVHAGTSARLNQGPHGLTELLYAFASQANNNGSAFAGLSGDTTFWNLTGALAMLGGRYLPILAVLAIAGSLAAKDRVPAGAGTFPTHTLLFVGLLVSVVVIVGALTFFPVLALGPLVEQLLQGTGRLF